MYRLVVSGFWSLGNKKKNYTFTLVVKKMAYYFDIPN